MKIVHIDVTGPYTEGMTYQENILPRYHKNMGHDVYMIASCKAWEKTSMVTVAPCRKTMRDGVKLIRLPYKFYVCNFVSDKIRNPRGLFSVLSMIKPDFIMLHDVSTAAVYQVKRYVETQHIPLIVDCHTDCSNSAKNWLSKNILHKIIYRRFAKVIDPVTKHFYGTLPSRVDFLRNVYALPKEKCSLLQMGVDDELRKYACERKNVAAIRSKYLINENDFLIVTGGKIDWFKMQTLDLMRVVAQMESKNIVLVIFGSVIKELEEKFHNLLKMSENIHYIGWLDEKETCELIASADLCVYPGGHSSLWELSAGLGIPLIVNYWNGGASHLNVTGNVKYLFKSDKDEIYELVEGLTSNSKSYETMRRAAQDAKEVFSYNNIAKKCLEYVKIEIG